MSNVLSNLFGDIADAIRAKTGGTGTMKPAEFPAEIAAIETGGVVGDEWIANSGSFEATGAEDEMVEVEHGMGQIPDIVIVYTQLAGDIPTAEYGYCAFCMNYSKAFGDALEAGDVSDGIGTTAGQMFYLFRDTTGTARVVVLGSLVRIDEATPDDAASCIGYATANKFNLYAIPATNNRFLGGKTYFWRAFARKKV